MTKSIFIVILIIASLSVLCCADDGKDGGIGKDHGGDGKHDGDGKGHGGDCGTKCPKYEVKNPCGNYCEPTCKKPNPKNCPQKPACTCQDGYLRDTEHSQKCVPEKKCPKKHGDGY